MRQRFIRVYLRLSAVGVVVLLAAGCADLSWHRDGADFAALERDLGDCRNLARVHAVHLAWPFRYNVSRVVVVDRFGRAVATPYPFWLDTDRFMMEFDLTNFCMRSKGYVLVPVKKSHDE